MAYQPLLGYFMLKSVFFCFFLILFCLFGGLSKNLQKIKTEININVNTDKDIEKRTLYLAAKLVFFKNPMD